MWCAVYGVVEFGLHGAIMRRGGEIIGNGSPLNPLWMLLRALDERTRDHAMPRGSSRHAGDSSVFAVSAQRRTRHTIAGKKMSASESVAPHRIPPAPSFPARANFSANAAASAGGAK